MVINPTSAIASLQGLQPLQQPGLRTEDVQGAQGAGFAQTLQKAVESVNTTQLDARGALDALASGEKVDLHGTMIALERAEISLRAMASVRDKLVGAYEQVMNMAL